ncbi:MAG TPA: glycosyltransferase family 2 protein [Myxococcales bacterium]|jgi:glycosyltransferase involved in cell wall biosynthesis
MTKKLISIVTPCYNEEDNVEELARQIRDVMGTLPDYEYEHIFIDNASTDGTQPILRRLAQEHANIKVILNVRNFGHIRSPHYGFLQARGAAVISMASDLQDPPQLLVSFIKKWEEGYKVVLGQKTESDEPSLMRLIRSSYYRLARKLAEVDLLEHVTGFGLCDREVAEQFRKVEDQLPYSRGLVSEFGYPVARVAYRQPLRKRGLSKNNFYTLYDMAMLGLTGHSKIPLRLATMLGFGGSVLSLMVGLLYLVYKIVFWDRFSVGIAPLVIGLFLSSSVQLFFLGVVGEYIGAIHRQVYKRPYVIEKERINFD